MTCNTCGASLAIGDFPFCPHGPIRAGRGADVTWPGGKTFENLGDAPQTFYSPAELKAYCDQRRIEPFVRHVPVPGSDKSPHTTTWAGMDAQTLANATALLTRVGSGKTPTPETYIREFVPSTEVGVTTVQGSW